MLKMTIGEEFAARRVLTCRRWSWTGPPWPRVGILDPWDLQAAHNMSWERYTGPFTDRRRQGGRGHGQLHSYLHGAIFGLGGRLHDGAWGPHRRPQK